MARHAINAERAVEMLRDHSPHNVLPSPAPPSPSELVDLTQRDSPGGPARNELFAASLALSRR
jgi:hypothetical protein